MATKLDVDQAREDGHNQATIAAVHAIADAALSTSEEYARLRFALICIRRITRDGDTDVVIAS